MAIGVVELVRRGGLPWQDAGLQASRRVHSLQTCVVVHENRRMPSDEAAHHLDCSAPHAKLHANTVLPAALSRAQ